MLLKNIYHFFLIRHSGLFDLQYYLNNYPEVQQMKKDPIWHFVQYGWREGKDPSENFDVSFYLENNPDVKTSGINPLVHFIHHGKAEGRLPNAGGADGQKSSDSTQGGEEIMPGSPGDEKNDILLSSPAELSKFDEKISIIIPTKNAGDDFESLLKMLQNQVGFTGMEIVIVDSGSQDSTVQTAENYNAKVIEIPPEDFSHSYARNLGAKNASGDYLLFTVQDALPPSKTWLRTLMTALKEKNVSAVSCAEQPREDADLFYRVICWNHYKFLEVNNADRILSMPSEPNYFNLRKNGQLSDLACLIPAKLFNKYQYRFSYAEDLDLGLRLIEEGHKLAFLGTIRIIHSHNRTAFYFLKRGFVDNLTLSNIFSDFHIPETHLKAAIEDIAFIHHFIGSHIFPEISRINYPLSLEKFENNLVQTVNSASSFHYPQHNNLAQVQYIDPKLAIFINKLLGISGYKKAGMRYDGKLMVSFLDFLYSTFRYLEIAHDTIDEKISKEFYQCLIKGAANISGGSLAFAYLNQSENKRDEFSSIYSILRENV